VIPVRYKLNLYMLCRIKLDRLCALVVRVTDHRSRRLGPTSEATRFSEK
jgi:hypothetical protein